MDNQAPDVQPASDGATPRAANAGLGGYLRRTIFGGNAYNRAEFAGAFGDLGTFIPFVIGYITINHIDPVGILLSFGLFKIIVGLRFKTPVPVQPMKAIGGAAIANPAAFTHGMIVGSGLFTAVFWTVMALTGAIEWVAKITAKPVVRGIMVGLGLSFMLHGLEMMTQEVWLAATAMVITFLLLSNRRLPAMLALLGLGIAASLVRNPDLIPQMAQISVRARLPEFVLGSFSWNEMLVGALVLGIPQVPLTLGNAILATVGENNRLFPDRPLNTRTVALEHGFMNFVAAGIGGVPLCHGAGGMAGHVRFGARTGGALVILGLIVLTLGLFFSDSVVLLLGLIPQAVLGVILFIAGLELAAVVRDIGPKRADVYVLLVTAGIAVVHIGVAFVAGLALYYATENGLVKV
ncbi:MAG: putative sulfate/molybdate transporter [Dehalococcoidales bacterium]|nr:putative sulfate/molybdate transporter [Dehalococcoidales bacterium]